MLVDSHVPCTGGQEQEAAGTLGANIAVSVPLYITPLDGTYFSTSIYHIGLGTTDAASYNLPIISAGGDCSHFFAPKAHGQHLGITLLVTVLTTVFSLCFMVQLQEGGLF